MDMKKLKNFISDRRTWIALTALVLTVALAGTAAAWYVVQRRVAAAAPIDSPMSIFIDAGHREDIMYLDLSGIDMERQDDMGNRYNYQDFVFTVAGEAIASFNLQLAYTTNNQFSYEIYRATESETPGGHVDYVSTETVEGVNKHYYYTMAGEKLDMKYLNTLSGDMLGDPAHELNEQTYAAGSGKYGNVNQYAEPIYCQTRTPEASNMSGWEFCNYFILRVKWSPEKTNDKETDLIYIAAKAGS